MNRRDFIKSSVAALIVARAYGRETPGVLAESREVSFMQFRFA